MKHPKAYIAFVCLAFFAWGCTAPQSRTGWLPESKKEMHMLVGQSVLEAISQYQAHIRAMEREQAMKTKNRLEPGHVDERMH